MDGQEFLWSAGLAYLPEERFEVIECLLHGNVHSVIRALRSKATREKRRGKAREALERICEYFEHNAQRMAYHESLAAGYPIASGGIEGGACGCAVNDRMERRGIRWVFAGAHAMLGLRSISLSGLWEELMAFRIGQESQRLYSHRPANDPDMSFACAA